MKQFDKIRATFTPRRTDDLREGADKFIGRESTWQALWIYEDDEPHPGEWAMVPDVTENWPFVWAPLSDLTPVKP